MKVRKDLAITVFGLLMTLYVGGQNIAINTTGTAADATAMLDVASTKKGLLIPRVSLTSTTDATTIPSPTTSLLVYNSNAGMTNGAVGYWYWDGAKWVQFLYGGSGGLAWLTLGNAGTVDGTNFLGTTDNIPFSIRVNNIRSGRIDHLRNNTTFGYQAGLNLPATNGGAHNIAIGTQSLYTQNYATAFNSFNVAIGSYAMNQNNPTSTSTGYLNTAVGAYAMYDNRTSNSNAAFGYFSMYNTRTGGKNTAIGAEAMLGGPNKSNHENVTIGYVSIYTSAKD